MAIIVYYQKKEVMVCSEIPADANTFSNPFVDHVSCVATALALKARKKRASLLLQHIQKLSLSSSLWYANEHRLHTTQKEESILPSHILICSLYEKPYRDLWSKTDLSAARVSASVYLKSP